MRAYKRLGNRGFTLVELMIVVAIIGVLAALAIYGVRRYLASSKTSEAKNTIGAIARGAAGAYEREVAVSEDVAEGMESATASHSTCGTSSLVPAAGVPQGKKYQPNTAGDYETNDSSTGWKCLKFAMSQPHYYQYGYAQNGLVAMSVNPGGAPAAGFSAAAFGDLDGDMATSEFSTRGVINATTKKLKRDTQLYILEEFE